MTQDNQCLPTPAQMATHFRHQANLLEDWDSMLNAAPLAAHEILAPEQIAADYRLIADTFAHPRFAEDHSPESETVAAEEDIPFFSKYPIAHLGERVSARREMLTEDRGDEGKAAALPSPKRRTQPRVRR